MKETVFITGRSSGIGRAAARLFASKGGNVAATMCNPAAEKDLNQISNVLVTKLDVQDLDSIGQAMNVGITRFGRVDALSTVRAMDNMACLKRFQEKRLRSSSTSMSSASRMSRGPSCHIYAKTKAA